MLLFSALSVAGNISTLFPGQRSRGYDYCFLWLTQFAKVSPHKFNLLSGHGCKEPIYGHIHWITERSKSLVLSLTSMGSRLWGRRIPQFSDFMFVCTNALVPV
jgi:hypothetical protein